MPDVSRHLIAARPVNRLFQEGLKTAQWGEFNADGFPSPVSGIVYGNRDYLWSGMPMGGLATGCLDLDNDGRLGYSTLFTHVWGHDAGSDGSRRWRDVTWSTIGDLYVDDPTRGKLGTPLLGMSVGEKVCVLTTTPLENLATATGIEYWGHFPVADLEYATDSPVQVGLRCWSPFLPGDAEDSNIPGAVFEVRMRNASAEPVTGRLAINFPGPRPRELEGKSLARGEIQSSDGSWRGVLVETADKLGYALVALDQPAVHIGGGLGCDGPRWSMIHSALPPFQPALGEPDASLAVDYELAPGETVTIRFVLAWHAPTWSSDFPHDGIPDKTFQKMYATRFAYARAVVDYLAGRHHDILRRILAWQEVIYCETTLPPWMRDGLISILHLFPECGFWGAPEGELASWSEPRGVFSLVESTVADGQQSCIPCDWYGNLPLVFFFPELARTTLRAYTHFMRDDGAIPFTLGRGLDLVGEAQHDRQRTLNGCCFVDLVDRLWQRTGDDAVLIDFYPAVRESVGYMIGLVPGPAGVISTAGDQWYESMAWPGMSSHVGGVRLATLRLAERMAARMGDETFRAQCAGWLKDGRKTLEDELWQGTHYRLFNDEIPAGVEQRHQTNREGAEFIANVNEGAGQKADLLLAHVLDGEWIAALHGVERVFDRDRARTTLGAISRMSNLLTTAGLMVVVGGDGKQTSFGGRMGGLSSMPASVFITAMNFLYEGMREEGLRIAHECLGELCLCQGMTWDMPNILIGSPDGEHRRVYGTDYYQCMSLWGLPAALAREDIGQATGRDSLVDRVARAARKSAPNVGEQ